MRRRDVLDYSVYLVVRILICLVQALRIETGQWLAGGLAWVFCDVIRLREKVVLENLKQAFPQHSDRHRRRLARQMWEHLFLLVLEVAHAPRKIHETNWRNFVRLADEQELVRFLLEDRPVVIVAAHFGNFEIGGFMLGILGFPTYTVARTLDNPYLDRFLCSFRGQTGQYIIPKKGGYEQIARVMASGGTMTLLGDQHAGPKGCWVDFFGRPASTHKAIGLLALGNDAPLAVCSTRRLGRPLRFEVRCTDIVDPLTADDRLGTVRGLTEWYTACLERLIRKAPDQYWWLHRRWKPKPVRRKKKAA